MTDQMEYQEKGPLMICNHRVWLAVAVRAEDRDVVMEMEVCVVYVCEERESLPQAKCSTTHGTNLKSSFRGCHTKGSDDH